MGGEIIGMLTYEQAKKIAISNTIPDGKVYSAGDAGNFYIFTIVPKDFPMDISNLMFGSTFTAVNKNDGKVWTVSITDPRLRNVKKLVDKGKAV